MFHRIKKLIRGIKYLPAFFTLLHLVGFFSSIEAVMSTRTPQGAVAWAISLNTFPSVALPAYWVFGRSKFNGYVRAWQKDESNLFPIAPEVMAEVSSFRPPPTLITLPLCKPGKSWPNSPFSRATGLSCSSTGRIPSVPSSLGSTRPEITSWYSSTSLRTTR